MLASAHDGQALLDALEEHTPDVVLTDLEMPGLDGFDVLRRAAGVAPVIVVTMHSSPEHRATAVSLGAAGFLPKSTPLAELAAAIRAVAMGETLLDLTTQREILSRHMEPVLDPGAASLTARERELLGKLSDGVTSTHDLVERALHLRKDRKEPSGQHLREAGGGRSSPGGHRGHPVGDHRTVNLPPRGGMGPPTYGRCTLSVVLWVL